MKVTDMTHVRPMPVDWLWENRIIARGKITVIAGQPGVIIFPEDDVAGTVIVMPRLMASNADISLIPEKKVTGEGGDVLGMLDLAKNINNIERVIQYEIGGAARLVVDPVSAYLGSTDQNSNGDIQSALFPIAEMAKLPRHEFEKLANKHHSGRMFRTASRWSQFVTMAVYRQDL